MTVNSEQWAMVRDQPLRFTVHRSLFTLLFSLFALLFSPPPLAAQDTTKTSPFALAVDFGLINTAGNTSTLSINGSEAASYQLEKWSVREDFAIIYGRSEGTKTAEQYTAALRFDRSLTPRVKAYAVGGYYRNIFSGIDYQYQEGIGLVYEVIAEERHQLSTEAGISYVQETPVAAPRNDFAAIRLAGDYKYLLNKTAFISEGLEVLSDIRVGTDLRINSETSVVAPISSEVAIRLGYTVRFDNLPQPGFKKTDRYLTTGLQINL